jgi:hypothetical protein
MYQLQCKKCNAFYIGERDQMLLKCVNKYRYLSTSNPTSSIFWNADLLASYTISLPLLTVFATNLKWHTYLSLTLMLHQCSTQTHVISYASEIGAQSYTLLAF